MTSGKHGADFSYNGLLVSLNRRLKSNLSLLFNYTWAHCINDSDVFTIRSLAPIRILTAWLAMRAMRSDARQIYNLSLVAGTPHWTKNLAELAAADWHLSLIVSGHSGYWFGPSTGSDASLTGVSCRPNI